MYAILNLSSRPRAGLLTFESEARGIEAAYADLKLGDLAFEVPYYTIGRLGYPLQGRGRRGDDQAIRSNDFGGTRD